MLDLAEWLEYEVPIQIIGDQYCDHSDRDKPATWMERRSEYKPHKATAILHGSEQKRKTDRQNCLPGEIEGVLFILRHCATLLEPVQ